MRERVRAKQITLIDMRANDGTTVPEPIRKCIGHFIKRFAQRFGCAPIVVPGRDHKLMKVLVANVGEPQTLRLIDLFFQFDDDRHVRESTYSIPAFFRLANRLIVLEAKQNGSAGDRLRARAASIAAEVRRWQQQEH
jgi:hypothetical protein